MEIEVRFYVRGRRYVTSRITTYALRIAFSLAKYELFPTFGRDYVYILINFAMKIPTYATPNGEFSCKLFNTSSESA